MLFLVCCVLALFRKRATITKILISFMALPFCTLPTQHNYYYVRFFFLLPANPAESKSSIVSFFGGGFLAFLSLASSLTASSACFSFMAFLASILACNAALSFSLRFKTSPPYTHVCVCVYTVHAKSNVDEYRSLLPSSLSLSNNQLSKCTDLSLSLGLCLLFCQVLGTISFSLVTTGHFFVVTQLP